MDGCKDSGFFGGGWEWIIIIIVVILIFFPGIFGGTSCGPGFGCGPKEC